MNKKFEPLDNIFLEEPYKNNNRYNYLYKIVYLPDNLYYYGVHSTKNLYDGYNGSGKEINKLYEVFTKNNKSLNKYFKKYIIKFFDNINDMFLYENKIVNIEALNDNKCLNLILGGDWRKSIRNKKMLHNNENKLIYVDNDNLDNFISLGWKLGAPSDNIFYYIHNENETKHISKTFLNSYLLNGWELGRHVNDKEIWITNNIEEKHVSIKRAKQYYFNKGWKCGRIIDMSGEKNASFGKIWIYKDNIRKYINKNDLQSYLLDGWERGFLRNNENIHKLHLKWINNGNDNIKVSDNELQIYLSNGWTQGRCNYIRNNEKYT